MDGGDVTTISSPTRAFLPTPEVVGGKVIGGTDEIGTLVAEPGWHGQRPIYPEDVLATNLLRDGHRLGEEDYRHPHGASLLLY